MYSLVDLPPSSGLNRYVYALHGKYYNGMVLEEAMYRQGKGFQVPPRLRDI
jgi:hypothetical protein